MLRSMKDLENTTISATDGQIGHAKDCYFDDDSWVIRYLVVDAGSWLAGFGMDPVDRAEREREETAHLRAEQARHRHDDPHLRSCNAVNGYHIAATDGEIGHVAGFLIDDETWAVRYLIVDTSNWWVGNKMLIAPQWITGVHWSDETVSVGLTRTALKEAPPYDPNVAWSREPDLQLYRHYGRTG